jgi:hypothetical protein
MRAACLTLLLIFTLGVAAPATRPDEMEPLVDGSVRYTPPAGWELVSKSDNRLKAIYKSRNGMDLIEINVTPETRDIPDSQAPRMAGIIAKGVREGAKAAGRDFTLPPRVEQDERFFLKVHDRMRGQDDEGKDFIADRIQIYRVLGLNLIHVAVVAITDDEKEAGKVHGIAEEMLYGMRLTRGMHPVVFGKAQIKVTTPLDWKVSKTDEPNGLVGTFTDPKDPLRQIIVRARVIPKDARTDDAKREAFLAKTIDAERKLPPLKGDAAEAEHPATAPVPTGMTYLRHLRSTAAKGEQKLAVDTRYFVVADVLVSVRSVAAEGDGEIDKITDELSTSVKPARE